MFVLGIYIAHYYTFLPFFSFFFLEGLREFVFSYPFCGPFKPITAYYRTYIYIYRSYLYHITSLGVYWKPFYSFRGKKKVASLLSMTLPLIQLPNIQMLHAFICSLVSWKNEPWASSLAQEVLVSRPTCKWCLHAPRISPCFA